MGIESLLQQNVLNAGLAGTDRLARNAMFPQSQMDKTQYAVPSQMPTSAETIRSDYDAPTNAYTGLPLQPFAKGGIATLRYNGEEDGSQVEAPAEEKRPPTMAELADQLKTAYRTNANYDDIWKQFAATKEQDPQAWYKHQLDFLGNQVGWQIGQNTGERAQVLQPQIQNTIEQAKAAGLKEDEIGNILASSNQEANMANQRRIAEEAAQGKGWVNQNIPGGWTTVGAAAALAAAPYLAPELFAGMGATEAGALTTGEILGSTGFVPAAGSGASFAIPAGAYTAAGLGGAAGSGSWGLSPELAAELGLEGSTSGLGTSGAQGSAALEAMGLNTGSSGITPAMAKKALAAYSLGSKGLNMLSPQAGPVSTTSSGYGSSSGISAIPYPNMRGVTGYVGEVPTTSEFGISPVQLSRIKGGVGDLAFSGGGISSLGGYSDGGRLLKGPGDGMSDNIPASISNKQPARLADGEFVIPADVVSHLGNGSTDAGAKQLYSMMDRIRKARTGNKKQGKQIDPRKFLP